MISDSDSAQMLPESAAVGGTRWRQTTDAPRGTDYDARWDQMAAAGENIHGEADLICTLLGEYGGSHVLDAGCGTGRVAIELARRGVTAVGVDADSAMLAAARAKAPELSFYEADLIDLSKLGGDPFDLIVLAGNVVIFLAPGSECRVLTQLAARLRPHGVLVAGFSLRPGQPAVEEYDRCAEYAGLLPVARWSTWERSTYAGGDYIVAVHRAPGAEPEATPPPHRSPRS